MKKAKNQGKGNRTNHATVADEIKKSAKITISCTKSRAEAIQKYAKENGQTVTAWLLELVDRYERKEARKAKKIDCLKENAQIPGQMEISYKGQSD